MERKELDVILKLHAEWIRGISTGKRADLSGANLSRANLYRANLSEADLSGADLYRADLSGADLSGADLYRADLSEADLSGANLSRANLYRANLSEADLYRANIYEAKNAELVIAQTRILPAGDLIVWKKCQNGVIVKLRVRTETKRSHAFGRKCRAESVDVLEVYGSDCGVSIHDRKTTYRTGETVTCDKWNEDFTVECDGGIHFFITREEAEAFDL